MVGNGCFGWGCAEGFSWDTSVPVPTLPAELLVEHRAPGGGCFGIWGIPPPMGSGILEVGGFGPQSKNPNSLHKDELKLLQPLPQVWLVLSKPQLPVQPELPKIRAEKPKYLQKQDSNLAKQLQSLGSSQNPSVYFHIDTILPSPERIWGESCSQMSLWASWACRETIWDESMNDLHSLFTSNHAGFG